MKIKNLSQRNVSALGAHRKSGGMPSRILIPAGASLEVEDELYKTCSQAVESLIEAGVLKLVIPKKPKRTPDSIKADAVKAS